MRNARVADRVSGICVGSAGQFDLSESYVACARVKCTLCFPQQPNVRSVTSHQYGR